MKDQGRKFVVNLKLWSVNAGLFWLYMLLFSFFLSPESIKADFESPILSFVVDYRWIIFLGTLLLSLTVSSAKRVFLWLCFALVFPFLLFGYVCYHVIKVGGWTAAIALFSGIVAAFRNFRSALALIFSLSFLLVLTTFPVPKGLAVVCIAIACLSLILLLWTALRAGLQPSVPLLRFCRFFDFARDDKRYNPVLPPLLEPRGIEDMSESETRNHQVQLEWSILYSRACIYLGEKILEYGDSSVKIFSNIVLVFFVLFGNWLFFSMVYYYYFIVSPDQFFVQSDRLLNWIYYSISSFFGRSYNSLTSAGDVAYGLELVQVVSALLIVAVFISSILSHRTERFRKETQEAVNLLSAEAKAMEEQVRGRFGAASLDAVIDELRSREGSLLELVERVRIGGLKALSKNEEEATSQSDAIEK